MRIGVDIQSLAGGRGPARYTGEILKALSAVCSRDDLFSLYTPFGKATNGLPDNFIFKLLPLEKRRPWLNWTLPLAVRRDRVELMFFPANDFWLWRAAPAVVTLHDVAPATLLNDKFVGRIDRLQNKLQMKALKKIASKVITVSNFSAGAIRSVVPGIEQKLLVIYNGVSAAFNSSDIPRTALQPYLLFVSGFDRRKNLERLLEAYKILLSKGFKEKLVLVGSAGQNERLYYNMPKLIAAFELQTFVDIKAGVNDEALARLYRSASALIFPSIIEGFGLPVLEAMACGCPVVSSNAASLPEVGGDAALYFDPYNVAEMADCLERVLDNEALRQQMIAKGYEQLKKFNWLMAGKQVYEILQEAALNRA